MIDMNERNLIHTFAKTRLAVTDEQKRAGTVTLRSSDVLRAEYFIDLLLTEIESLQRAAPPSTPHSEN